MDSCFEYRMGAKIGEPWTPVMWKGCKPWNMIETRPDEIADLVESLLMETFGWAPWKLCGGATIEYSNLKS